MTLAELKQVGQCGEVLDVAGDDAVAVRIMEMGLTEGEEISVLNIAPLGDPIEYLIRGYRLSLRLSEAQRVTIRPLDPK